MTKSKTNFKSNLIQSFLTVLYILLYVILPSILLSISFYIIPENSTGYFIIWTRGLYFFVTMPIYIIYAAMIFGTIAKMASGIVLILFIPQIFNLAWNVFNYNFSGKLFEIFVLDNIPLFCGIFFCFFLGMIYLFWKKADDEIIQKFIVFIILLAVIFTPVVYFFLRGWELTIELAGTYPIIDIIKYITAIIITMFSHYPVIIQLYKEGRL